MRLAGIAVVLGLVSAVAGTARAQPDLDEEPPPSDAEGRALFEAGRAAFQSGRYDSALDYFQQSYEVSRRPELLYNMAVSADRLRRDQDALGHYERFLREVPDAGNRGVVRTRIRFLRREIRRSETAEAREQRRIAELERRAAAAQARAERASEGPGALPWIVVAAGGVVAAAGTLALVVGLGDKDAVEHPAEGERWPMVESRADRAPVLMNGGLVGITLGIAGVAIGVVWALTGGGSTERSSAAIDAGPEGLRVRF